MKLYKTLLAAALVVGCGVSASAAHYNNFSDNFDDNTNPGWSKPSSGGYPTAPTMDFTGGALQLNVPATTGETKYTVTFRTNFVAANFTNQVDVISRPLNGIVGIFARANGVQFQANGEAVVHSERGYSLWLRRAGASSNSVALDIYRSDGGFSMEIASSSLHPPSPPAGVHRLRFTGVGSHLVGELFDVTEPDKVLLRVEANDTTYHSGYSGLLLFGEHVIGQGSATFDNFSVGTSGPLFRFTQNFDSGDDAGMSRFDPFAPFGAGAQFTFTNGAMTISAGPSPAPHISPSIAGDALWSPNLADVVASVDVWGWPDSADARPVFYLTVRGTGKANGKFDFYSLNLNPTPFPEAVAPSSPNAFLSIRKWVDSVPQEPPLSLVEFTNTTLSPTNRYRLVFSAQGDHLVGSLYQLPSLQNPIAIVSTHDSDYTGGYVGINILDKGLSGNPPRNNPIRVTVDNFTVVGTTVQPFQEFIENFDDGSDAGLDRYNPFAPFGFGASFTFSNGALTIAGPASPAPHISPAVAGATLVTPPHADAESSIDFWGWETSANARPVIYLTARGIEKSPGLFDFYSLVFSPVRHPEVLPPLNPEATLGINLFTNNNIKIPAIHYVTITNVTLNPSNRYRLTFSVLGDRLTGRLYDLANPSQPLVTVSGQDNTLSSGFFGFNVTDRGLRGSPAYNNPIRLTVDNFVVRGTLPSPALTIERAVALSWPAWAQAHGYQLQAAPSATGPWSPVNITPASSNGVNSVMTKVTGEMQVFRLQQGPE